MEKNVNTSEALIQMFCIGKLFSKSYFRGNWKTNAIACKVLELNESSWIIMSSSLDCYVKVFYTCKMLRLFIKSCVLYHALHIQCLHVLWEHCCWLTDWLLLLLVLVSWFCKKSEAWRIMNECNWSQLNCSMLTPLIIMNDMILKIHYHK